MPRPITGRHACLALAALLALAPAVAFAQSGTSVTNTPVVPARPPVTSNAAPIASDATSAPPERIARPDAATPGPGATTGAPLTGAPARQPAAPHG